MKSNISGCNNLIHIPDKFVYFSLVASFIVCLESVLVILTVWRTPVLHTNTHILVASLSVTDFCIGVFYIINGTTSLPELRDPAPEPNALASFVMGSGYSSTLLLVTHMAVIAIDRYVHIRHPFLYMKTVTTARRLKVLAGIWLTGLAYMAAPVFAYTSDSYHEDCIQLNPPLEYFSILVVVYLLSSCLVFVCYLKIATVAFKHRRAAIARRAQFAPTDDVESFRNSRLAAMRSMKFFAATFGLFSICSFPPMFATATNYVYPLPQPFFITVTYMFPAHSFLNFPLYVYMNRDFAQALRTLYAYVKQC